MYDTPFCKGRMCKFAIKYIGMQMTPEELVEKVMEECPYLLEHVVTKDGAK